MIGALLSCDVARSYCFLPVVQCDTVLSVTFDNQDMYNEAYHTTLTDFFTISTCSYTIHEREAISKLTSGLLLLNDRKTP